MAKPKDPKRRRRYGVLECERQQIRVYCYENPGNLRETLLAILPMDHKLLLATEVALLLRCRTPNDYGHRRSN